MNSINSFAQNNRYEVESDADLHSGSLKKINQRRSKFFSSMSENDPVPECRDLEEFFTSKLSVAATTIRNLELDARICRIDNGSVIVDMNLKNYGRLPKDEIRIGNDILDVKIGDVIQVVAESIDAVNSRYISVSWEKAKRIKLWDTFLENMKNRTVLHGAIIGETRGGYIVNIQGVKCFCPGSHCDFKILDRAAIEELKATEQPFIILSMERDEPGIGGSGKHKQKDNIAVSRKEVLNQMRMEIKDQVMSKIQLGDVLKGVVKSIASYGCFVNLIVGDGYDGVDGLLHINDISWKKVNHCSEVVSIGQEVEVKVIGLSPQERRISLGMKQLKDSPWKGMAERLKVGDIVKVCITNKTDYGYFALLPEGIEGLIHLSEVSWGKRPMQLTAGQEVDVVILTIDEEKSRISLSIKQCSKNPYLEFSQKYKIGSIMKVVVKKIVDFGLIVGLDSDNLEGLIYMSDLSWESRITSSSIPLVGSTIDAKLLNIDVDKGKISFGIKQCIKDYFEDFLKSVRVGQIVSGKVVGSWGNNIEINILAARTTVSSDIKNFPELSDKNKDTFYMNNYDINCKVLEVNPDTRSIVLVSENFTIPPLSTDSQSVEQQNINS